MKAFTFLRSGGGWGVENCLLPSFYWSNGYSIISGLENVAHVNQFISEELTFLGG